MRKLFLILSGVGMLWATSAHPVTAADAKGCEGFLWPLATELSWMNAADAEKVASGATLAAIPPGKAIEVALLPLAQVTFPGKPTRTPKPDDDQTFGGVVHVAGTPAATHYQVTISDHGWVDVVQNGAPLEATGHTGSHDCKGIRKSVRFEVAPGPFSIQVSGTRSPSIRVVIRPAAD